MPSVKYLAVAPTDRISHSAWIPSSKPETQRAILVATLARGKSVIYNDLRCLETSTMKNACRSIGAKKTEEPGRLIIYGTGDQISSKSKVIDAMGSGLEFRVLTALTCFTDKPAVITGDTILRTRMMEPLLDAINSLGGNVSSINIAPFLIEIKCDKQHATPNTEYNRRIKSHPLI